MLKRPAWIPTNEFWVAYKSYLLSPEWRAKREELFALRGKKCERCSSTNKIQVHHKNYYRIFKELLSDLEVLCRVCHEHEHAHQKSVQTRAKKFSKADVKEKRAIDRGFKGVRKFRK